MQVFAAESHAARSRRSIDVAALIGSTLMIVGMWIILDDRSELEERWLDFAAEIPLWIQWFAQAVYLVGWIYFFFLLIGLGLVARQRHDLLRDMLIAIAVPILVSIAMSLAINDEFPDVPLLLGGEDIADTFPALTITVLTAVHATAAPYLSRPLRRLGWTIVLLASFMSLIGNVLLIRDVIGALLVGRAVAAAVHLVFGSPAGRPTLNRITQAAADIGVELKALTYAERQPPSFTVAEGTTGDGAAVRVSVLGHDADSSNWMDRAWRYAWYHDSIPPWGAGRRQQVEHSALAQVLAQRAGVSVSEVVGVGVGDVGDALLVSTAAGVDFASKTDAEIADGLLDSAWSESIKLHGAGISHGQLNAEHIAIQDGGAVLVDFESSQISVSPEHQRSDRAELLVSTALLVGEERALASAGRVASDEDLADTLPYLQQAALTPPLRHQVRHEHFSLKELRFAADQAGADDVKLEQLHRVSIGKVLMNVVTVLAVYAVMTGLAQIGFDEILDSIRGATWSLVILALVLVQFTNLAEGVAVVGAAPKPMPLGITTTEQFAISFINLAVPSTAARVAVNMRFYQKFGIGPTAAATSGLLTSVSGFVVQIFLLLLLVIAGDQAIDWSQLNFSGSVLRLIGIAAVIGIVALIVMFAIGRIRRWILDHIREPIAHARETLGVLRSPKKLVQIFGGNLVSQVLYAMGLTLCVFAVGGSVSLSEAIFINTIVTLFAGLMPIPGGIGVSEAGLTAGLVAVGVPEDTAFAAVIIYRLCSYYLPPIWGWFAMHWLTENDYL